MIQTIEVKRRKLSNLNQTQNRRRHINFEMVPISFVDKPYSGWGGESTMCLSVQVFPCSAEMACITLMKLSDF